MPYYYYNFYAACLFLFMRFTRSNRSAPTTRKKTMEPTYTLNDIYLYVLPTFVILGTLTIVGVVLYRK